MLIVSYIKQYSSLRRHLAPVLLPGPELTSMASPGGWECSAVHTPYCISYLRAIDLSMSWPSSRFTQPRANSQCNSGLAWLVVQDPILLPVAVRVAAMPLHLGRDRSSKKIRSLT